MLVGVREPDDAVGADHELGGGPPRIVDQRTARLAALLLDGGDGAVAESATRPAGIGAFVAAPKAAAAAAVAVFWSIATWQRGCNNTRVQTLVMC